MGVQVSLYKTLGYARGVLQSHMAILCVLRNLQTDFQSVSLTLFIFLLTFAFPHIYPMYFVFLTEME